MKSIKISYRYQLLTYFLLLMVAMCLGFAYILILKDREVKVDRLKFQMLPYTDLIYNSLTKYDSINKATLVFIAKDLSSFLPWEMRVTIIDNQGFVLYDNFSSKESKFENHLNRPELQDALNKGFGTTLRKSKTLNSDYLYLAKKYPRLYIRTALEYNTSILPIIKGNFRFQIYIIILLLFIALILFYITKKVSMPVSSLKEFIDMVQNGNGDYKNIQFPNNEFGEVGEKIIQTFTQLEKTKQFKQELTHNIAHELKTPVTGIRGYLETLMQQDNLDKEKSKFFIERAYAQCMRLTSIIADISILNKIEEASDKFNIETINVKKCLQEIESDLSFKLEEKKITFKIDIDESLVIDGSNFLIYSLFKNLIDNSLEHGGDNIQISIENYKNDQEYAYFSYSDTGKGVSEKHIDRIFERFYRVEEGRSRKSGGSGLGLSIVKNSVHLHKGHISVKNREGGGLNFLFTLALRLN